MINTEIVEFNDFRESFCVTNTLERVNTLIKDCHINKEDIIEYRTEVWSKVDSMGDIRYYCRVIISWWS